MYEVMGAAKIGDTVYTLNDAFQYANDHAGTTVTITLIGDTIIDTALNLDQGSSVILEIGDHSIAGEVNGKMIQNHGTLVINGDKGCVYNTDVSDQTHDAITNYGTLTINGGWFGDYNNDMTDANANINRGAAVRNLGGTVTLNAGHFTAIDNDDDIYAYALINGDGEQINGTMYVNDGVYVYGANHGNIAANSGDVYVFGGDFSVTGAKSYYNIYSE